MSYATRQGLYSKLAATVALTAVVGERIHHDQAPENSQYPLCVFSKQTGTKVRAFSTPESFKKEIWSVKVIDRSTSSKLAEEAASAIDSALDGGTITVSGKSVADLHHVGDYEYLESVGDQQYRHVGADYAIVLT